MIELLKAVLFGIVEGITEWLPVSSTGHLILLNEFVTLQMSEEFNSMFDVVIQLGAILAVIVLFFHKLNPFAPSKTGLEKKQTWSLWFKVIAAILPSGIVGVLFDDWMDANLHNGIVVSIALIVYGIAFILVERRNQGKYQKAIDDVHLIDYKTGQPAGKRVPYNSWGNGSAMRASAVGWKFRTLEETENVAAISASITHDHPEGIKGAQATAAAIWMARNGKSKEEIKAYIEQRFGYDLDTHTDEIRKVYGWEESCQGTVPPAIRAFLDSTDFESAVRIAVSLGGDSDTLACITGGIAEAFYGEIPSEIVQAASEIIPAGFQYVLKVFEQGSYYGQRYSVCETRTESAPIAKKYTPNNITVLEENEIFVFGSVCKD